MSCCGANPGYDELDEVSRLVSTKLAAFLKTLRDNGFAIGLHEGRDAAALMTEGNTAPSEGGLNTTMVTGTGSAAAALLLAAMDTGMHAASIAAHKALGFADEAPTVRFRKWLPATGQE